MNTRASLLMAVALSLCMVVLARADEFKPAYLQLTQLSEETYDVLWKIPAIDETTRQLMTTASRYAIRVPRCES